MNENEIRALIRSEIRNAFTDASDAAEKWTHAGARDDVNSVGYTVRQIMIGTSRKIAEKDPEPPVPSKTPEQWVEEIKTVIRRAELDGMQVWVDREGTPWSLRIGPAVSDGADDPILWSDRQ